MDEDLRLSDGFAWERQRRRRAVDLRYLVALILFIVGPPLILALIGASWPAAVAVAVGIVVNLAGVYVGYRAMSQRVEIDRG